MSIQEPPTGPEVQQQSTGNKTLEEIQLSSLCNWCRNALVISSPFSDANFIDTGVKWHSTDSDNAEAVYCTDCLADSFRTNSPKSVIDRATLAEGEFADLPIS